MGRVEAAQASGEIAQHLLHAVGVEPDVGVALMVVARRLVVVGVLVVVVVIVMPMVMVVAAL